MVLVFKYWDFSYFDVLKEKNHFRKAVKLTPYMAIKQFRMKFFCLTRCGFLIKVTEPASFCNFNL